MAAFGSSGEYEQWVGGLYRREEHRIPVHERLYMEAELRSQVQQEKQAIRSLAEQQQCEEERECVFRPALGDRTAQIANRLNRQDTDVVDRLAKPRARPPPPAPAPSEAASQQPRPVRREGPTVWERLEKAPIHNFRSDPPAPHAVQTTFRPSVHATGTTVHTPRGGRNVFDRLYPAPAPKTERSSSEHSGVSTLRRASSFTKGPAAHVPTQAGGAGRSRANTLGGRGAEVSVFRDDDAMGGMGCVAAAHPSGQPVSAFGSHSTRVIVVDEDAEDEEEDDEDGHHPPAAAAADDIVVNVYGSRGAEGGHAEDDAEPWQPPTPLHPNGGEASLQVSAFQQQHQQQQHQLTPMQNPLHSLSPSRDGWDVSPEERQDMTPPAPQPAAPASNQGALRYIMAGDAVAVRRSYLSGEVLQGEASLSWLGAAVVADRPSVVACLCEAMGVAGGVSRGGDADDADEASRCNPRHILFENPATGRNVLHLCALLGRAQCLRALMSHPSLGSDILRMMHACDLSGHTPLMLAAGANNKGLFSHLISDPLRCTVSCPDGPVAGRLDGRPTTLILLNWKNTVHLAEGGRTTAVDIKELSRTGVAELIRFISGKVEGGDMSALDTQYMYLEEHGWYGNDVDPEGTEVLKMILSYDGEGVHRAGPGGVTALHHAIRCGWVDRVMLVRSALQGFATVPPDAERRTLLHHCCLHNQPEALNLITTEIRCANQHDSHGRTAYDYAKASPSPAPLLRILQRSTDAEMTSPHPPPGSGGSGEVLRRRGAMWHVRAVLYAVLAAPSVLTASLATKGACLGVALVDVFRGIGVQADDDTSSGTAAAAPQQQRSASGATAASSIPGSEASAPPPPAAGRTEAQWLFLGLLCACLLLHVVLLGVSAALTESGSSLDALRGTAAAILLLPTALLAYRGFRGGSHHYFTSARENSPHAASLRPALVLACLPVALRALLLMSLAGTAVDSHGEGGPLWTKPAGTALLLQWGDGTAAFAISLALACVAILGCGVLHYIAYERGCVYPSVEDDPRLTMCSLIGCAACCGKAHGPVGDWEVEGTPWFRRYLVVVVHGCGPFLFYGLVQPALQAGGGDGFSGFQTLMGVLAAYGVSAVVLPYVSRMAAPHTPPVLTHTDGAHALLLALLRAMLDPIPFHATAVVLTAGVVWVHDLFDPGLEAVSNPKEEEEGGRAGTGFRITHLLRVLPVCAAAWLSLLLFIHEVAGGGSGAAKAVTVLLFVGLAFAACVLYRREVATCVASVWRRCSPHRESAEGRGTDASGSDGSDGDGGARDGGMSAPAAALPPTPVLPPAAARPPLFRLPNLSAPQNYSMRASTLMSDQSPSTPDSHAMQRQGVAPHALMYPEEVPVRRAGVSAPLCPPSGPARHLGAVKGVSSGPKMAAPIHHTHQVGQAYQQALYP